MPPLRARLVSAAFRVIHSPRFARLVEDHGVLEAIVVGLSVEARARVALRRTGAGVARVLGLATMEDLREVEEAARRRR